MTANLSALPYILEQHAYSQPNKPACVFIEDQPQGQYSYVELFTKAKAIAAYKSALKAKSDFKDAKDALARLGG